MRLLSEKEMNELGAKILKAEIMGNNVGIEEIQDLMNYFAKKKINYLLHRLFETKDGNECSYIWFDSHILKFRILIF